MIVYRGTRNDDRIEIFAYFLFIKVGYIQVDIITQKAQINYYSVHTFFRKHGIGRNLINRTKHYISETEVNELHVFPHSHDCISNKDITIEDLYDNILKLVDLYDIIY